MAAFASVYGHADTWTDSATGLTWNYTVAGGAASIVGPSNNTPSVSPAPTGTVAIPATLGGFPVTSIGQCAFFGCSGLVGVSIPDGVTSIGNYAFRNCGSLANIDIPGGVTNIGSYAFAGCSGLRSVYIPTSLAAIAEGAFADCWNVNSVVIPQLVLDMGLWSVFPESLYVLEHVKILDGATRIPAYSFF